MEENTLETTERNFTIEDLHRKKAEAELLSKSKGKAVKEFQEILENDKEKTSESQDVERD